METMSEKDMEAALTGYPTVWGVRAAQVRMPEDLYRRLIEVQTFLNHDPNALPISLNELVVEAVRTCLPSFEKVQLEGDDASGPGIVGVPESAHPLNPAEHVTLAAAIERVLATTGRPMTVAEIRRGIIAKDLYRTRDRRPPSHQQVRNCALNYRQQFQILRDAEPHRVVLRQQSNKKVEDDQL